MLSQSNIAVGAGAMVATAAAATPIVILRTIGTTGRENFLTTEGNENAGQKPKLLLIGNLWLEAYTVGFSSFTRP